MVQVIDDYNKKNINKVLDKNKINFKSIVTKFITDAKISKDMLLLIQKLVAMYLVLLRVEHLK